MNLRLARPGESEELSALAIAAKAFWGYSPQQLAVWADQFRISRESIATEPTFVIEENGRLAGVAQLSHESSRWAIECLWVHLRPFGVGSANACCSMSSPTRAAMAKPSCASTLTPTLKRSTVSASRRHLDAERLTACLAAV